MPGDVRKRSVPNRNGQKKKYPVVLLKKKIFILNGFYKALFLLELFKIKGEPDPKI